MRHAALAILLALVPGLFACLKNETLTTIKPDGSGTISISMQMGSAMIAQMKAMAEGFGGQPGGGKPADMFSEEEAKKKAATMGEGVTLTKFEKIKSADYEGFKALYSFTDISKLKLESSPGGPGPGGGGPKEQLKLKLTKLESGNSLLSIVIPGMAKAFEEGAKDKPKADEKPAKPEVEPEEDPQFAVMKEMLKGMKINISMAVDGTLVKSNSPHVTGNTVTIMEIDFDAMLTDEKGFKKIQKAAPGSPEEAMKLMKDIKGFKVNLAPETTIEFK